MKRVVLCIVACIILAGCEPAPEVNDMAVAAYTVERKYDPHDSIEYNEVEGVVRIERTYIATGAYATSAIGAPFGVVGVAGTPPAIPHSISVDVVVPRPPHVATATISDPGTGMDVPAPGVAGTAQTVTCYSTGRVVNGVSALALEAESASTITVTYVGAVVGLISQSMNISTDSSKLVVDLNTYHAAWYGEGVGGAGDAFYINPPGVGVKAEGANRHVPTANYEVIENIRAEAFGARYSDLQRLTGAVNEEGWEPTMLGGIYHEGEFLYLGATFEPIGRYYYKVTHSLHIDVAGLPSVPDADVVSDRRNLDATSNTYHRYRWRGFKDKPDLDADGNKITRRFYDANEHIAQQYPIAGEGLDEDGLEIEMLPGDFVTIRFNRNALDGRDLRDYTFADTLGF